MEVKVSVIIPVYNAEKYINECIESLLAQTMKNCEFIFINDGSKDGSEHIIRKYKEKDERIILVTQENQGVSITRNKGLEIARGEFIGFLDADDYVDKSMYETMYCAAREWGTDVIISNFESTLNGYKMVNKYPFVSGKILNSNYIKNEVLPYFLKSDNLNSIWNKLYKRKIIIENKISFRPDLSWGEDACFNISYFCFAKDMVYKDYVGYHYREVPGSATRNSNEMDYFHKVLEIYKMDFHEIRNQINDEDKIQKLKSIKLINNILSLVHIYSNPLNIESYFNRASYVKKMINHKAVREALKYYQFEENRILGKYEKILLIFIKRKIVAGILLLTAYSRFRNGNNGGS